MKPHPRFAIFMDDRLQYRWRLIGANNKVVADGSEGYHSKPAVKKALARVIQLIGSGLPIEEVQRVRP